MNQVELEEAIVVDITMPPVAMTNAPITSAVAFTHTSAGPFNSPEISYVIVGEPAALDGAAYPALVAVWDNEQDAIFDTV